MLKWPFQRLSDFQLGDEKVTLNHLAININYFVCCKSSRFSFGMRRVPACCCMTQALVGEIVKMKCLLSEGRSYVKYKGHKHQIWMNEAMFNASCRCLGSLKHREHPCRIDHDAPATVPYLPQKKPHMCSGGVSKRSIGSFICWLNLDIFCYPLVAFISVFFVSLGNLLTMNLPNLSHIFQNTKTFNSELLEIPNSIPFFCRMRLVSGFVATQQKSNDFRHGNQDKGTILLKRSILYTSLEIKHQWWDVLETVPIQASQVSWSVHQPIPYRYLWDICDRYHTDICETLPRWHQAIPLNISPVLKNWAVGWNF